jgi:hypothetical protein
MDTGHAGVTTVTSDLPPTTKGSDEHPRQSLKRTLSAVNTPGRAYSHFEVDLNGEAERVDGDTRTKSKTCWA